MWEIKNFFAHFLVKFLTDVDEIKYLSQPTALLKLMRNLYCTISIQGRNFYIHNFIKYACNIGLRWGTCKHDLFYTWNDAGQDLPLQLDFSVNDLDLQSRSQEQGKAESCAVILV